MLSQRSLFSILIVFYVFLNGSVYAETSYEISGLNLESSMSDVEEKLGCKVDAHFRDKKSTSTPDSYGTYCNKNDVLHMISFDKNKRITTLYASTKYELGISWDSIKDKLVKKYGKPSKTLVKEFARKNEKTNTKQICWGTCIESEGISLEPEMNSLSISLDDTMDVKTGKREVSVSSFMSHTVRLEKHKALRDEWLVLKKKEKNP